jgi:hypothetical protein
MTEKITPEMIEHLDTYPPAALETTAKNMKRCLHAAAAAGAMADQEGRSETERRKLATMAYRLNMPAMTDMASIQAYIGCVAQGIAVGIFTNHDGSQLLYAAQVAMSIERNKRLADKKNRRAKSEEGKHERA